MNEPALIATEAAASAGIVVAITGSLFGMPFDSILCGFVGALVAQTLVPGGATLAELTRLQMYLRSFLQLVAAGLLAGLLTPLVESAVHSLAPFKLPVAAVHMAVAGVIGMIAPVIVPLFRKFAERWGTK